MIEDMWQAIAHNLKERISAEDFQVWFGTIDEPTWDGTTLVIFVPNQYSLDKLTDKFYPHLKEALLAVAGPQAKVEISVRARAATVPVEPAKSRPVAPVTVAGPAAAQTVALFPRYTFDNFVSGDSNQFAYAAALAVANLPGDPQRGYNPLFIYGGTGLGKTHLMVAIGHSVLAKQPQLKVVYVNGEQFGNEVVENIQHNTMSEFRARYRNIDVLLLDDIQFFSGKEYIQQEFFHTFNSLHGLKKQLVFTSDKAPKEMVGFEERVLSRFTWGLTTDIQPPNLETRIAILKKRADEMHAYVPDEIINFIAHNIKTHIRDLEGALNKIINYTQFTRQDPSIAIVKDQLKDMIDDKWQSRVIMVSDIQKAVADHFHLNIADLKSRKKTGSVSFPRQIAMFLTRELTELSLAEIGAEFGGRDHTTVIHAFKKISEEAEKDQNTARIIAAVKERL